MTTDLSKKTDVKLSLTFTCFASFVNNCLGSFYFLYLSQNMANLTRQGSQNSDEKGKFCFGLIIPITLKKVTSEEGGHEIYSKNI
jgi:hypothetical protein